MTSKAVISQKEEDERRALIAQEQKEDGPSGDLRPPRYKLVSTSQAFQQTLTEDIVKEIPGIIIAARKARAFWGEREVATPANQSPLCSSTDGTTGICQDIDRFVEVAEQRGVADDITPFAPTPCEQCPFSKWGKRNEKKPPACKEMRRLLIMVEGSSLPAIMSIPPSSILNWDNYRSGLLSKGESFFSVKTTISAEKATNPEGIAYSKIVFHKENDLPLSDLRIALTFRKEFEALVSQQAVGEEYQAEAE